MAAPGFNSNRSQLDDETPRRCSLSPAPSMAKFFEGEPLKMRDVRSASVGLSDHRGCRRSALEHTAGQGILIPTKLQQLRISAATIRSDSSEAVEVSNQKSKTLGRSERQGQKHRRRLQRKPRRGLLPWHLRREGVDALAAQHPKPAELFAKRQRSALLGLVAKLLQAPLHDLRRARKHLLLHRVRDQTRAL